MAIMITDMAVGQQSQLSWRLKQNIWPFLPEPFKNGKILVTVVHQDKLIAMGTSHVMKLPEAVHQTFVGYEEY